MTPEMVTPMTTLHAPTRALVAGSIGNFIEWYEFAVYGFLATAMAKNFFTLEGESAITSLILTYATFAVAFFLPSVGCSGVWSHG